MGLEELTATTGGWWLMNGDSEGRPCAEVATWRSIGMALAALAALINLVDKVKAALERGDDDGERLWR